MELTTITNSQALETFCVAISNDAFITVDTEFMRESTYWPKLCLIQVAGENLSALIDPLSKNIDMTPFWNILDNSNILKVFHAARQDLEAFYKNSGRIPRPIFDTQIAGMVLGLGEQISYSDLIKKFTGQTLDKTERFTDWARRPLSQAQLTYALADVIPLRAAYIKIVEQLNSRERTHWVFEELDALNNLDLYAQPPKDAWKRVKLRPSKLKEMGVLVELAQWRERVAQEKNIPRGRLIKDETLQDLILRAPTTKEALLNMRGVYLSIEEHAEEIIAAIQNGLTRTQQSLPQLVKHTQFPPKLNTTVDLLKMLMRAVSESNDVASKLLGNTEDLQAIAQFGEAANVPALHGWRRKLFGEYALQLVHGELHFGLGEDGMLNIIEISTGKIMHV